MRPLLTLAVLSMFSFMASAGDDAVEQAEREAALIEDRITGLTSTLTVIRLNWASAEELAATLAPLLPPGVTVVAYPPINALIISRNPIPEKR
ncbi:MAG: secretin N-terminal domain-containing protein [Acidiferrobacterales bacterium]